MNEKAEELFRKIKIILVSHIDSDEALERLNDLFIELMNLIKEKDNG